MSTRKSLYDISWQVSEEQYRQDPALSYSLLAKFEREGFNNLDKLFDRVESPSLTLGSMVDTLITGTRKEFDERFFVADFPSIGDKEKLITKALFTESNIPLDFNEVNNFSILAAANMYEFQKNWRNETRIKVLRERCAPYYNLMFAAGDKTIVDNKTYQDCLNMVEALKTSEATKWYFQEDNPFESHIERLYQLKFKATLYDVDYRVMMDLCIIDHNNKKIYPCDLKTSGKPEWDFFKSFIDWRY